MTREQQMPQNDKVQQQLDLLADAVGELYDALFVLARDGSLREERVGVARDLFCSRRLAALRSSASDSAKVDKLERCLMCGHDRRHLFGWPGSKRTGCEQPGCECPTMMLTLPAAASDGPQVDDFEAWRADVGRDIEDLAGSINRLTERVIALEASDGPQMCQTRNCVRARHDLSDPCMTEDGLHWISMAELDARSDPPEPDHYTAEHVAAIERERDEAARALVELSAERDTAIRQRDEFAEAAEQTRKAWLAEDRYTAEEIAAAMRTTFGYSSKMLLDRLAETRPLSEPSRMVRVYLSARFGRAEEVFQRGQELIQLGYDVTSRWYHADADESKLTPADWARIAADDLADIERADVLVAFTEPLRNDAEQLYANGAWLNAQTRGGRHVETGWALAKGLRVVVIGPRENAFHHLPQVEQFDSWDAYAATIGRAEVNHAV
jgi:hypothetical protein